MANGVTICCYGTESNWDSRERATSYYEIMMIDAYDAGCTGSEFERYFTVWSNLKRTDEDYVSDEDVLW